MVAFDDSELSKGLFNADAGLSGGLVPYEGVDQAEMPVEGKLAVGGALVVREPVERAVRLEDATELHSEALHPRREVGETLPLIVPALGHDAEVGRVGGDEVDGGIRKAGEEVERVAVVVGINERGHGGGGGG